MEYSKGKFAIPEISDDSPLEFSDISLRTMQTDLEAIKKSGGITNEVNKSAIKINITPKIKKDEVITKPSTHKQFPVIQQKQSPNENQEFKIPELSNNQKTKLNLILKTILYLGTIIIFFSIGYFILPKIIPNKITQQINPEIVTSTNNQINNQVLNNQTSTFQNTNNQSNTPQAENTILYSITNLPKENFLEFNIDPKIPNFKKYYYFLINDALSKNTSTKATTTLNIFIINLKDPNNNPVKWIDFLKSSEINLINEDFWNTNFNSNFIGFIYKNKNNVWPGYILEIKSNIPPLTIQVNLKNLYDFRNYLSNFYLNSVDFSKTELQNSLIFNKEPITILKTSSGEKFIYGIFLNKYLILSTSIEGLEEILKTIIK
ncbi:MAG: hypothetical protein N2Z85_00435 [Patescibacteria group bacterium]|nr:hypothetical protein [Patescibacteria group bacterium]